MISYVIVVDIFVQFVGLYIITTMYLVHDVLYLDWE